MICSTPIVCSTNGKMVVWVGDQGQLNGRVIPPQHFLTQKSDHHSCCTISSKPKKNIKNGVSSSYPIWALFQVSKYEKRPKKKSLNRFTTLKRKLRFKPNAWVGSIGDIGSHLEVLGQERGFLGFVYIHPKLNGTKSQRSPFSKLRG